MVPALPQDRIPLLPSLCPRMFREEEVSARVTLFIKIDLLPPINPPKIFPQPISRLRTLAQIQLLTAAGPD